MKNCKKPKCVYSVNKKSCIKPNPYIQFISYCTKSNKSLTECKKEYNKKTDYIKNNACDYYSQNNKTEKKPQKLNLQSCPKPRRPLNGKCPEISPVLKLNKHNVECCYKDLTKKKVQEKIVKPKANAKTKGKKQEDFETILRRELKSTSPSRKGTSESFRSAVSSSTPAKKRTSESFHSPLSSNKSSRKGTSESFRSAVSSNKSSKKGTSESFHSPLSSNKSSRKGTSESFRSPLSSNKSSKKGTSESFHSAVSSHSNDELNKILRRQRDRIKREEQKKSSSSNDSFHSARQSPVNPFENILRKQQQKDYLDTKKKKYFKVVNKYGNKKPVKEITKIKQS